MLQEFLCHRVGVDAAGHEEMPLVAKDAHQFGSQCLVQQLDDRGAVGPVAIGDGAVLDVLAGAGAQGLDVGEEGVLGCRCSFGFCHDRLLENGLKNCPSAASSTIITANLAIRPSLAGIGWPLRWVAMMASWLVTGIIALVLPGPGRWGRPA